MFYDKPEECDRVGQRFKREGTYLYLWLMHVDILQKPTEYCKTIILQLKINKLKKKRKKQRHYSANIGPSSQGYGLSSGHGCER